LPILNQTAIDKTPRHIRSIVETRGNSEKKSRLNHCAIGGGWTGV